LLNTFVLYLRWAYFSTRMTATGHNATVQNLLDTLEREREKRPHWGEFADRWQASERPRPLFVPESQGEPGPQPTESHWHNEDVLP
jgi:3'-5' exonuclease